MKKQDSPGGIAMLVLALLRGEEMYGYQIIVELERRSEGVFRMKEGSLYPVLHALEKERLLEAREELSDAGRKRRYYRITQAGLRALEEQESAWRAYAGAVTAILLGAQGAAV